KNSSGREICPVPAPQQEPRQREKDRDEEVRARHHAVKEAARIRAGLESNVRDDDAGARHGPQPLQRGQERRGWAHRIPAGGCSYGGRGCQCSGQSGCSIMLSCALLPGKTRWQGGVGESLSHRWLRRGWICCERNIDSSCTFKFCLAKV